MIFQDRKDGGRQAPETCEELRGEVDEIVCAVTQAPLLGVGLWYKDFSQTTNEEVRELLQRAPQQQQYAASRAH
jgi:putative phosphoribosyl transferase